MTKQILQTYVDRGFSSYKIAKEIQKSPTTVRYWLKKYDLKTVHSRPTISSTRECPRCNQVKPREQFYKRRGVEGASVYCKPCTKEQTLERQRGIKIKVVSYMGGKCNRCSYNRCPGALQVHHLDPKTKNSDYHNMKLRTFDEAFKQELDKCVLLCANCHAEEHTGYCN